MYLFFKRTFDLVFSFLALLVFSPIFMVAAIIIKLNSEGPVIYKGERTSKDDGIFNLYKFRTMVVDAEDKGGYSTALDDPRLTSVGRFLRKYKLDEIPQFINVLFGDMSLVGPRPQVKYYTNQYKGDDLLILKVKPGITDLATLYFSDMDSVLGKKNVDDKYAKEIEPQKNLLRLQYVKKRSFILDLRILIATILRFIGAKGVSSFHKDIK